LIISIAGSHKRQGPAGRATGPTLAWGVLEATSLKSEEQALRPRRNTQGIAVFVLAMGVILATALGGTAEGSPCPNEAFRVGPSAGLPNCRAYELASPVDKNGGEVEGFSGQFRAASEGSAITFYTQAGTQIPSPVGGTQTYSTYLARKSGETWATQRLLAPQAFGDSTFTDWLGATPDLRYSIVQAGRLARPEPSFGLGLFSIDTVTNEIETIVPWEDNRSGETRYAFDGASQDGSRIFFETQAELTPGSHEFDNLYMWDKATQEVTLVGILPTAEGGEASEFGAFGGAYEWYAVPNEFEGGALGGLAVEAANAISPSGDQIYFTTPLNTAFEFDQIYLRRGLTGPTPSTVRVSAPEAGVTDPNGTMPAAFQEATPSGSKAFFLSSGKLTADATTGPADEGKDLYRWDEASEKLVDVAPDPSAPAGAEVQGLVGISSDGSSGYFVAKGELVAGQGTVGSPNLYRFVETSGGGFTITFIATLLTAPPEANVDKRNWSPRTYSAQSGGKVVSTEKPWKTSRTSADGNVLVFTSTASLTGYNNTNSTPGVDCDLSTEPCAEIYRYSASDNKLTCVSCQPQGALPLGSAQLESNVVNSFLGPNTSPNVQLTRNLSLDGSRLFFETPDPLVAADTNGSEGCPYYKQSGGGIPLESEPECQDVYEWEAPGSASCPVAEVNEGCVHLLSTGKSTSASYFLDASPDGSNVFIATRQQLVPVDRDVVTDVYDVAVNGGLAAQQVVPEQPCEGEGCRGPLTSPPTAGNTASSRFEGPGNEVKPKKKHHKKKHHKKKHRTGQAGRALNSNAGGGK
jgi:hypothetical protein